MAKAVNYHRGFQHGRADALEGNPRQPREPGKDYAEGYTDSYKDGLDADITQWLMSRRPNGLTTQQMRDIWKQAILRRRRKR